MKQNIAVFASGGGSNAEKLLAYFENHATIQIALLVTNNKKAGVLEKAKGKVETLILSKEETKSGVSLALEMQKREIHFLVLAGYLKKIPRDLITVFPKRIINIHPALLPKYGGKGMYGMNVHRAVKENKEIKSGITIHLVNEEYDKGEILFQDTVSIFPEDSPEEIQKKVLKLEHQSFASVVENYIQSF